MNDESCKHNVVYGKRCNKCIQEYKDFCKTILKGLK